MHRRLEETRDPIALTLMDSAQDRIVHMIVLEQSDDLPAAVSPLSLRQDDAERATSLLACFVNG